MKKVLLSLSLLILVALACGLPQAASTPTSPPPLPTQPILPPSETPAEIPPTDLPVPATEAPGETPIAPPPSFKGTEASFGWLSFILPPGLASGISGSQFPAAAGENVAPWEVTPGHIQITLDGYPLPEKFHQPQIFVYPAQGYAELGPAAFESIHRLDNILSGPRAPISAEQLPGVPFFNAAQVFAANIQVISFQNGQGVRFLTEYAQYFAPVNNYELIYHFQGLTRDGAYYIIAILPITAPMLAETSDPAAAIPPGGISLPDMADANADWQGYYTAVTALLGAAPPESFAPAINQLDLLIQSMLITP
ncbi:MAG: hypothetical protein JW726_18045 [Anaerolineales bacterium]|nr:hypothetical protein [Anaerolineales bacterium]